MPWPVTLEVSLGPCMNAVPLLLVVCAAPQPLVTGRSRFRSSRCSFVTVSRQRAQGRGFSFQDGIFVGSLFKGTLNVNYQRSFMLNKDRELEG